MANEKLYRIFLVREDQMGVVKARTPSDALRKAKASGMISGNADYRVRSDRELYESRR